MLDVLSRNWRSDYQAKSIVDKIFRPILRIYVRQCDIIIFVSCGWNQSEDHHKQYFKHHYQSVDPDIEEKKVTEMDNILLVWPVQEILTLSEKDMHN